MRKSADFRQHLLIESAIIASDGISLSSVFFRQWNKLVFINKKRDCKEERKFISKLIFDVLSEKISVREALIRFPKNCSNGSIEAAWHALCHLEADEDLRKKDKMYADTQDEYIEYIALTLSKGLELPENIINSYLPYHDEALIPSDNTFKSIIRCFKKFLCCKN